MKNILKMFVGFCLVAVAISSCKKDENRIVFQKGSAPVLTANRSATIPLSFITADNPAIAFTWTNPDYKFTTGVSSQDVTYLLEIDTTGANFTNPKRKQLSIGNELSQAFTQSQINDYLLNQLELTAARPHNIELRVKSSLAGSAATELFSNVLKFTVTPYAIPPKITPPASGELYITGDALASSWVNNPPVSQKFTRISNTFYTLNVQLTGGKSYTFLANFGSWDFKYSIKDKNDPALKDGGDFQWGGEDILAPDASGNYKIDVNFQTGKFSVTKI